jgi:hypothetical protein
VTLNRAWFFCTVKKEKVTICRASMYDINKAIQAMVLKECPLEEIVPTEYHEFLSTV